MDVDAILDSLTTQSTALATAIRNDAFGEIASLHDIDSQRALRDSADIHHRLASLEQAESSTEELIRSLSLSLATMKAQRMFLQQILVPINMLPVEILQRIFYIAYRECDNPAWRPKYTRTICSVSRRWRDIGTSQPELWSTILLDHNEQYVHLCVERARQERFDVTHSYGTLDDQKWVSRGVCPLDRWRSLSIECENDSARWHTCRKLFPKLGTAGLEKATIALSTKSRYSYTSLDTSAIKSLTQQLTTLYVAHIPYLMLASSLSSTLINLRIDITIHDLDLRAVFTNCTQLERLWVQSIEGLSNAFIVPNGDDDDEDEDGDVPVDDVGSNPALLYPSPMLAPPTLRCLGFGDDVPIRYMTHISHYLRAPQLRELVFAVNKSSEYPMIRPLVLQAWFQGLPNLETLTISGEVAELEVVADALHNGASMYTSGLQSLDGETAEPPPFPPFLPNLVDLAFDWLSSEGGGDGKTRLYPAIAEDLRGFLAATQEAIFLGYAGGRGAKALNSLRVTGVPAEQMEELRPFVWNVYNGSASSVPFGSEELM